MKFEAIRVYQVDLPLHEGSYCWSGGKSVEVFDSNVIEVITDDGTAGYGECCPLGPFYLPAYADGVRSGIRELGPHLIGHDPLKLGPLNRLMDKAMRGQPYVKSPLDIACWDIAGQAAGLPISELMGGCYPTPTLVASSISTGTPQEMLAEIEGYRERGYRVHSAKVGADTVEDIERVRFLETHRNRGEVIFYDVNRAWTRAEAVTVMNAVVDLPVTFEQQCDCLLYRSDSADE